MPEKTQKLFDVRKYQNELPTLVDATDALANEKEMVISFYHLPSKRSVFFKAFITAFNETYNSNFTSHETFGRTDPIYQYKNTTRNITLAFKVVAASEGEAYDNLGKISALEQMLYPSYTEAGSATTISQAPLIRIKVMNLLQKNSEITQDQPIDDILSGLNRRQLFTDYVSTSEADLGLLGVINNTTINHNLEGDDGVFFKRKQELDPQTNRIVAKQVPNTILPKFIDVNIAFSPIHETTLGWQDGQQINYLFPYGAKTPENVLFGEGRDALPAYKEQVQKERDAELERKNSQQKLDNAKARYAKANGELRMGRVKRDERRLSRGNERAAERLQGLVDSSDYTLGASEFEFDEGFIE